MSLISIKNISAGYGKNSVIEDISLEINEGELIGILGANGSGKSTLAKAVLNILPHSGEVYVCDKVIEKLSPREVAKLISYVPSHSGINIDVSVFDVVMMGFNSKLGVLENPSKAMKEKAYSVLEMVGLLDKKDTNYMQLSEGQKQLAIIARALVNEGKMLIMDEPESALDFSVRYKMMDIIRNFITKEERALMVILHDTMLALNNCDKLVLIKDKRVDGIIDLKKDTIEQMETKLRNIYGNISLVRVKAKDRERLAMVHEG